MKSAQRERAAGWHKAAVTRIRLYQISAAHCHCTGRSYFGGVGGGGRVEDCWAGQQMWGVGSVCVCVSEHKGSPIGCPLDKASESEVDGKAPGGWRWECWGCGRGASNSSVTRPLSPPTMPRLRAGGKLSFHSPPSDMRWMAPDPAHLTCSHFAERPQLAAPWKIARLLLLRHLWINRQYYISVYTTGFDGRHAEAGRHVFSALAPIKRLCKNNTKQNTKR